MKDFFPTLLVTKEAQVNPLRLGKAVSGIHSMIQLQDSANVAESLHTLEDKELAEKTSQEYKVSDMFFAQWLIRAE